MSINSREAALTALERCRRDRAWSGAVIDSIIKKGGISKNDASLATRLCLGVLQNGRLCDYYVNHYCDKKLEPKVRDILRLGVYQLIFLDKIPARAAVNETVALCAYAKCERAAGLVNAVLRKISANIDSLPALPDKGGTEYLCVKYSFPEWFVQIMLDRYGYEFTEDYLRVCNEPPKLYIQVNTLKVRVSDYLRALERAEIAYTLSEGLEGCVMLEGGSVTELPGYEEGLFYVQDKAARAAVELSGIKPGMEIYDACSAPGGKAFAAAMLMNGQGGILCGDIHEKKLGALCDNAKRLGIEIIKTRCGDARVFDGALSEKFGLVIADVPCSGFGVVGKKPEIRLKEPETLEGLPDIQLDILRSVSGYVRKGGALLYSTCTVFKEENEDVVRRFIAENTDFRLTDMKNYYPNTDCTDGFFAARLEKER